MDRELISQPPLTNWFAFFFFFFQSADLFHDLLAVASRSSKNPYRSFAKRTFFLKDRDKYCLRLNCLHTAYLARIGRKFDKVRQGIHFIVGVTRYRADLKRKQLLSANLYGFPSACVPLLIATIVPVNVN